MKRATAIVQFSALGTSVGKRRDRALTSVRYLTSATDIPLIEWHSNAIQAPHPYQFNLITDRVWSRFEEAIPSDDQRLTAAIRYSHTTNGVDDAIVGMRMSTFTQLLRAHAEQISAERPFGRKEQ